MLGLACAALTGAQNCAHRIVKCVGLTIYIARYETFLIGLCRLRMLPDGYTVHTTQKMLLLTPSQQCW